MPHSDQLPIRAQIKMDEAIFDKTLIHLDQQFSYEFVRVFVTLLFEISEKKTLHSNVAKAYPIELLVGCHFPKNTRKFIFAVFVDLRVSFGR